MRRDFTTRSVILDMRERLNCPILILNETAARYAVARHYLGLVDVDE